MQKQKKSCRKRIFWLSLLLFLILFWAFNSFHLTETEVRIRDEKIRNPITVVQLSDLHGASFGRDNARLIRKIEAARPDLIAVTGDLYSGTTRGRKNGPDTAVRLLASLAEKYPVYYVNGEHDNDPAFFDALTDVGVTVLRNASEELTIADTELTLYGIGNAYFGPNFRLSAFFEAPDPDRYNILLAHLENFEKYAEFGMDLTLCGDTHGGIVRLPLIGPAVCDGIFFPKIRKIPCCDKGLYEKEDSLLFVCGGLGNYPVPLRLFNLPEIAVIRLLPENQ